MRTAPKTALFFAAVALAVGLTGCSAGGQSVADACKVIQDEGSAITTKAQEALSSAATDPEAAVDALGDVQKQFEDLSGKITNTEVKPVFSEFVSAYGDLTDAIGIIADNPENSGEAVTKMTDATTKVTDAGNTMSELCS